MGGVAVNGKLVASEKQKLLAAERGQLGKYSDQKNQEPAEEYYIRAQIFKNQAHVAYACGPPIVTLTDPVKVYLAVAAFFIVVVLITFMFDRWLCN